MTLKDEALIAMINEYLAKTDVLVSTHKFLTQLKEAILLTPDETHEETLDESIDTAFALGKIEEVEEVRNQILISCDASIKKNPGGPSSVGVVIRIPDRKESMEIARVTKSITNNQAEYDAIYTGLVSLLNLFNRPKYPITIYSDSQLIINQLRGKSSCKDTKLANKRDMILEVSKQIESGVTFEWRPRNSTEDLKQANYLAQDILGVKRH